MFVIRSDMSVRLRLLVAIGVAALAIGVESAWTLGSVLDPSFGDRGVVLTDFGSATLDQARAVAIQPDGKIVAVGYADGTFAVFRYTKQGQLDSGFGSGGIVRADFWQAQAVAIQPDGKIVVAGYTNTNDKDFALVRFTNNGALDPGFGTDGKVLTDFGSASDDEAYAAAVQPDGKIIAGGWSNVNGTYDFALARYEASGTLDPTFGASGKVLSAFGPAGDDFAYGLAVQADGKIVAAGHSFASGGWDFALARFTNTGAVDQSFGSGGTVLTDFGTGTNDQAWAAAVQDDGKIIVVGWSYQDVTSYDFALTRYTTTGALDMTFGSGGKVLTDFGSPSSDGAASVALGNHGSIVVAGTSNAAGSLDFALAAYTDTGALDTKFGNGGTVLTDFGTGSDDEAWGVAGQKDGKVVAAGFSDASGSYDFALTRYMQ